MKVSFSPPDMSQLEVNEVAEAIRSGWITSGPHTKEFENLIAMCCQTEKTVCLNSATACMELVYPNCLIGRDVEFRNEVINEMAKRGIACNVYFKPFPMMTTYKNLGFDIKDYPNA